MLRIAPVIALLATVDIDEALSHGEPLHSDITEFLDAFLPDEWDELRAHALLFQRDFLRAMKGCPEDSRLRRKPLADLF